MNELSCKFECVTPKKRSVHESLFPGETEIDSVAKADRARTDPSVRFQSEFYREVALRCKAQDK